MEPLPSPPLLSASREETAAADSQESIFRFLVAEVEQLWLPSNESVAFEAAFW